eukprot:PhM_4_TR3465/c0_g1_i1/m.25485
MYNTFAGGPSNSAPVPPIQCPPTKPEASSSAYPFKNLVFEGGGAKGAAYVGVVRALEEANILPQIKRVAGASAGAFTAAVVAAGITADHFERITREADMEKELFDGHCGTLCTCQLGRFFRGLCDCSQSNVGSFCCHYGLFPGHQLEQFIRNLMKDLTGDPDITFAKMYHHFGRELCVVVSDLNSSSPEYLHPK